MKIYSRFTKVAVAAGLVVATGAGVLGLTGFASAQVANNNPTVVTVADNNTNAANGDTVDGLENSETAPMHSGKGGQGHGHGGKGGRGPQKFAIAQLATTLKLTESELQTQLKSGTTLKQIAEAQNVDIADVKAALTAGFKAHLDEAVTSGKHTQAEADTKLAEFTTRLDDMVNGVRPAGGKGGHGPEGNGGRGHGGGRHGDMPGAPAQGSTSQGA